MNLALTVLLADWGMHGDDFGAGWMALMMIVMALFWGAVILGVVWLIRGGALGRTAPSGGSESALGILERRFAEGAISQEDYEARRRVLIDGRSR